MDNIETIDEDDCDGNKTLDNQFYECLVIDGHNKRFVCKYENCEQTEIDESVMINHLSLHLVQDLVDNDNDINDIQCQEEEEKQIDFRVVIDLSEESNNSNDCENTDNLLPKVDINSLNNGWEQWIQRKQIDSKDIHFCNWSDCHFETDLRIKLKRHIMNKHLNDKTDTNIQKTDSICHQIFNHNESVVKFECNSEISRNTAKYEKSKTAAKDMNKLNDMPIEMKNNDNSKFESFVSNLIDVSVGQNGRLSLKGMASVKKLKDHIDCKVVDGVKWYYCRYNDKCNYRSKRGQALCIHIHTAHIGVYLKCFQTNCGKIFRTATSWREHQKCHVCNFGCKGVTGVCSNRNINKYREKVVTDTNIKAYRCKWSDCNTTTVHSSGIRRHIHNTHICPYYNSDVWKDKFNESLQSCDDNNNNISNDYIIKPKQQQKQYLCHNNGCKLSFYNEVELRRHEKLFCELRKFSQKSAINNKRGFTKNKNNKNNEGYGNYKSIVKTNKNSLNIVKQKQKLSKNVTKNESKITKSLNNINDCQTSKTQVNDITTNYHQINQLINNKDIDPKCQKYVDISIFNGDDYFLCKYYDCKFSTKIVSKINEHIIRLHLGLNRIPNNEMNLRLRKQANNMTPEESSNQLDLSCGHTSDNNRKSFNFKSLTIPLKRIHSLHENKNDYKVKRQKICNKNNPINKPQETVNRELRSKIKRTADKLKKVSMSILWI
ncbi:uncharacterized protein LOC128951764 [Oppia nitens]|uniref:uncharacterized protein LOC128951764 n=1 Tax=Oppia nitens TaxID=1686743 RepID=UPI0023DB0A07|nr:uncharacterized protein LOC128951764 [Oppia nitens]